MANPFAYEEYRKEKIRQKIDESRTQRVNIQVGDFGGKALEKNSFERNGKNRCKCASLTCIHPNASVGGSFAPVCVTASP